VRFFPEKSIIVEFSSISQEKNLTNGVEWGRPWSLMFVGVKFNERLRFRRKEKGLSQPELAAESGLSKGSISNYERGERQPELDELVRLAVALGTTVAYLSGETDNPERDPVLELSNLQFRNPTGAPIDPKLIEILTMRVRAEEARLEAIKQLEEAIRSGSNPDQKAT
jgi:transcriptional regulator with XRE-family HTH domain